MSTVASRTFSSTPHRDAMSTWTAIVELLTQGKATAARKELLAVAGVAASVIADQAPKSAAIIVTCDGPRTRIYCTYDDDAIDGSNASEDPLGFDPIKGDWRISLPCLAEDIDWVQGALKQKSIRITARDPDAVISTNTSSGAEKAQALALDLEGFLRS